MEKSLQKHLRTVSLLFIGLLLCSCTKWWKNAKNAVQSTTPVAVESKEGAKLYFEFKKDKDNSWLARSGDVEVTAPEVDAAQSMQIVNAKEQDVFLMLFFMQFLGDSKKAPNTITIYAPKPTDRSVESLLNQHGIALNKKTKIEFTDKKDSKIFANIDGKEILKSQISLQHYLWGAYITEKFQTQLNEVDRLIKNKRIVLEAKSRNMNVQDYRKEYVDQFMKVKMSDEEVAKFRVEMNLPNSEEGRVTAQRMMREALEKKGFDYFLEKYLLALPIQVNLEKPQFFMEFGKEYVPTYGPANSEVKMLIFADSNSPSSNALLAALPQLSKEYKGIHVEYRPLLASDDVFQVLREKFNYCVWETAPNQFWNFLSASQGIFREKTEEKLLSVLDEMKIDRSVIDQCVRAAHSTEVIQYQKKYAEFLGIFAGPMVFIAGEVLIPPVSVDSVKKVMNRYLGVAEAAVW